MRSFISELVFEYGQSTGSLSLVDPEDGSALIGRGYSGKADGFNNPDAEDQIAVGPIPRGVWRIHAPIDHPRLGPQALRLSRAEIPHGRSAFLIHGDNSRANGSASSGCVIMPRPVRDFIARSGIRTLIVYRD